MRASSRRLLSTIISGGGIKSGVKSAPTLAHVERVAHDLLHYKRAPRVVIPPGSPSIEEHPLSLNLAAIELILAGKDGVKLASQAVRVLQEQIGSTSDDFVDIAGCLNDQAVSLLSANQVVPEHDLSNLELAVSALKRAIYKAERAYKVNRHLQLCLTCNLMEVHRLMGQRVSALESAQKVFHLVKTGAASSPQDVDAAAPITSQVWPAYRAIQVKLVAARCISLLQSQEEGIIFFNSALKDLSADTVLSLPLRRILITTALVDLWQLRNGLPTGSQVSTAHVVNDSLAYITNIMHIAGSLPLSAIVSLASSQAEIETAIHSLLPHLPRPDGPSRAGTEDEERMARYLGLPLRTGKLAPRYVVGVGLIDSQFHCAPQS